MSDSASGWLHNSTILDLSGNLAGAGTRRSGQTVGWARPLPMPRRAPTATNATNASQPPPARPLGIIGRVGRGGGWGRREERGKGADWDGGMRVGGRQDSHGPVRSSLV